MQKTNKPLATYHKEQYSREMNDRTRHIGTCLPLLIAKLKQT